MCSADMSFMVTRMRLCVAVCLLSLLAGLVLAEEKVEKHASVHLLKKVLAEYFHYADQLKDVLAREASFENEEELEILLEDLDKVTDVTDLHHPLNALRIIRRLSSLQQISRQTRRKSTELSTFTQTLPNMGDIGGAHDAVIRLHQVYGCSTRGLIKGVVQGKQAKFGLLPEDVLEISTAAQYAEQFASAIEWLDSLQYFEPGTPGLAAAVKSARENKLKIYNKNGMYDKALELAKEMVKHDEEDETAPQLVKMIEEMMENEELWDPDEAEFMVMSERQYASASYINLCRTANDKLVAREPLMCVYQPALLPYVRYQEEVLSMEPRISLFYNIITEDEVNLFTKRVITKLERAKVGWDMRLVAKTRLEYTQVIPDVRHKRVAAVSRRFSHITGIDVTQHKKHVLSESWQVCNSGILGKFDPHFDTIEALDTKPRGKPTKGAETRIRLATFSLYLSDVESGGEIVFPQLGIHVPVIKRAAVVWYNFNRAGQVYKNMQNGLCPLVFGDRWGMFKMLPLETQMYTRPCGLTENDRVPLFYRDIDS